MDLMNEFHAPGFVSSFLRLGFGRFEPAHAALQRLAGYDTGGEGELER